MAALTLSIQGAKRVEVPEFSVILNYLFCFLKRLNSIFTNVLPLVITKGFNAFSYCNHGNGMCFCLFCVPFSL